MNNAPHTLWRRPLTLIVWLWGSGPTRLKAAQLRREGDIAAACRLMFGTHATLAAYLAEPDRAVRTRRLVRILRMVCAAMEL